MTYEEYVYVVEEPPVLHVDSNAVQSPLPRELITIEALLSTRTAVTRAPYSAEPSCCAA